MKTTLWKKDFTLMLAGQVISLFGNGVLRFALPLYLLSETGSSALFGLVSALSMIPMVLLTPVGGMIADRVHKQRIMVVLDFSTALLAGGYLFLQGKVPLIPLVTAAMMLLSGIGGAYQPSVQASVPLLVEKKDLVAANAAVSLVSSLAGLLGPVLGGMLYGGFGLRLILTVSGLCFFVSAVMELFIRIPHIPRPRQPLFAMVKTDMGESFRFLFREKPLLMKGGLLACGLNLFLSAMLMVGMPVVIIQALGLDSVWYGYTEGALAAGGLLGGLFAGALGSRLKIRKAYQSLFLCTLTLLPMGLSLLWLPVFPAYLVITASALLLMALSTIFSVQMMAYLQKETPKALVGKVLSCIIALSGCAMPLGQALYGGLFELLPPAAVVLAAAAASLAITLLGRQLFREIPEDADEK